MLENNLVCNNLARQSWPLLRARLCQICSHWFPLELFIPNSMQNFSSSLNRESNRRCSPVSAASLSAASLATVLLGVSQPAQAASFAESTGGFRFDNFTSAPLAADSDTRTFTSTAGKGADAEANADALFKLFPRAEAFNLVSNSAFGSRKGDRAYAESEASVIGEFFVAAGESLKFDFSGFLDLFTATDTAKDSASAAFETQYSVFRQSADAKTLEEVDYFSLLGQVNTPNGQDGYDLAKSDAIALNYLDVADNTGPDAPVESLLVETSGRYSRLFAEDSALTLVELKLASSLASQDVPDASSPLLGLLGIGGVILWQRSRNSEPRFTR